MSTGPGGRDSLKICQKDEDVETGVVQRLRAGGRAGLPGMWKWRGTGTYVEEGDLPSEKVDKLGVLRPLSLPSVGLGEAVHVGGEEGGFRRKERKSGRTIKQVCTVKTIAVVPTEGAGEVLSQPVQAQWMWWTEPPHTEKEAAIWLAWTAGCYAVPRDQELLALDLVRRHNLPPPFFWCPNDVIWSLEGGLA